MPPLVIDVTLTTNEYTSASPSASTGEYPSELSVLHIKANVSPGFAFIGEPKLTTTVDPTLIASLIAPAVPLSVKSKTADERLQMLLCYLFLSYH